MANSVIEQYPKVTRMPVGQPVIFVVSNNDLVATQTKVKFVAKVHISDNNAVTLSNSSTVIGTFKTTPNNAGVGIFDFRSVIENFVKADNLAKEGSQYKTTTTIDPTNHPMHLIDKFSGNNNTARYFAVQFKVEYLGADPDYPTQVNIPQNTSANSDSYKIFNGYLKYTDKLELAANNFGYNIDSFYLNNQFDKFLSNAPTTQYANINDYGTFPMLNRGGTWEIEFKFYEADGSYISSFEVERTTANGAAAYDSKIGYEILYFGCFPGNLQNYSSTFRALVSSGQIDGGYYTVQAEAINIPGKSTGDAISQLYTINVNCATLKGYEPIRLTWINQWGGWDYYTFTQKSINKISTKGSTYNQIEGTWNESSYRLNGFKGGKKSFRVNATEAITMNTDFVNESESEWFEELINSPEVYILAEYFDRIETQAALTEYVTPVRLTTSSYTRKTVANDRLMQYTFEVEKSKTLRTQSI
tara:strand:+ start:144 stop:1562 length:1419 start_codon:yes stop_codon:yes gene_type:complete